MKKRHHRLLKHYGDAERELMWFAQRKHHEARVRVRYERGTRERSR